MIKSRTLAREGRSDREHGKKRVDSTMKECRFHGGGGGQAKRISLVEVGESISG